MVELTRLTSVAGAPRAYLHADCHIDADVPQAFAADAVRRAMARIIFICLTSTIEIFILCGVLIEDGLQPQVQLRAG